MTVKPRPALSRISHRRLLQVGRSSMLGLSLPNFLAAGEETLVAPWKQRKDRSYIFIVQAGGPSHLDTWDPRRVSWTFQADCPLALLTSPVDTKADKTGSLR